MSSSDTYNRIKTVPNGYVAIPITEDQKSAILKICVLIRPDPDPVGGHLVVIRDTTDARVFMGCVIDICGCIHEWLELWVQNTGQLIDRASAYRQSLSNAMLDDRWRQQCQAFEQLDEGVVVKTGWESEHPLPMFLDISTCSPLHPTDTNSGAPWKLCKDEGLLQQKGLPSYCGSLHRYLYIPAAGTDSQFAPVTPGAPTNAFTKPMSEICGDPRQIIPFNPGAGLMLVKKHNPIGLETFIDILSGSIWDGLKHGRSVLDLGEQVDALRKDKTILIANGRLFLDSQGRRGRLVETFHLKLRLLADIVSSVHSMVHHLQRPLLNINPNNWQIKLGEPGRGLPFLWTAKPVLSDPGDAIPLAIEKTDVQYYLQSSAPGTSIYRPAIISLPTRGHASVRIRQVLPDTDVAIIVEGTFTTQERIEIASRDLVWFRLNLTHGSVNLYAHIEADSAMAAGEWRFRTVTQSVNDVEVSDLHAAEGVPMPGIPFEIIPLLSTPCDLYSLAVVAVRVLLVDDTTTLPVALDEILSLSRQTRTDSDASTSLDARISDIFSKDNRWLESLGPHHLAFDKMTPDEAFGLIPHELWWKTVAIILRMFPGAGPESECKDFGDAQQGGLHKVFERTMADLDNLILRTRGLIITDWKSNQEVADVIQRYLS
ncbi:MAG: hypothetical protein JXA81_04075 [Sedimentisphaerales bacterium]|nr:hypothetical protein [Sedimentisphaerales bacterium]